MSGVFRASSSTLGRRVMTRRLPLASCTIGAERSEQKTRCSAIEFLGPAKSEDPTAVFFRRAAIQWHHANARFTGTNHILLHSDRMDRKQHDRRLSRNLSRMGSDGTFGPLPEQLYLRQHLRRGPPDRSVIGVHLQCSPDHHCQPIAKYPVPKDGDYSAR